MDDAHERGMDRDALFYHFLHENEWSRLLPTFNRTKRLGSLPHPKMSSAIVAETHDKLIVGGGMLQLVLHAEPFWVADGWHGRVNLLRIEKLMQTKLVDHPILPGYLLHATDEQQATLAELAGFERMKDWIVYRKEF